MMIEMLKHRIRWVAISAIAIFTRDHLQIHSKGQGVERTKIYA